MDKDGRLSAEEFAIAMHLLEKAKAGLTLPATLPASLSPSTTKFNTLARSSPQSNKKVSQSVEWYVLCTCRPYLVHQSLSCTRSFRFQIQV